MTEDFSRFNDDSGTFFDRREKIRTESVIG